MYACFLWNRSLTKAWEVSSQDNDLLDVRAAAMLAVFSEMHTSCMMFIPSLRVLRLLEGGLTRTNEHTDKTSDMQEGK
jgi:hypothetical protein